MIFLIVLFLAIGVIGFFHYLQGFFSATISAVLAAVAALLALSFYEPVTMLLLGGKMANFAQGAMLLVLFATFYIIPRVLFDKMVPGNLRMPAVVDKVGGALMGVVAGVFACGIAAIAAQMLPFMPNIAGYTTYGVQDNRPVSTPAVGRNRRQMDALLYDEVSADEPGKFDETKRASIPVLPVDDIVVGLLKQQSDSGALSSSNKLTNVHPDLLQELFGQRLGIQTGAQRVVVHNVSKGLDAVRGVDLYRLDKLPPEVVDFGYAQMRPPDWKKKKFAQELQPKPNQVLLVARVRLGRAAGDGKKYMMRFSPGSIRLVAGKSTASGTIEPANYFPIGTIDKANKLYVSRIDDFMFTNVAEDRAVDFAFLVDREGLFGKGGGAAPAAAPAGANASAAAAAAAAQPAVKEDVFLEVNRMAVADLSGKPVQPPSAYKEDPQVKVMYPEPIPTPEGVPAPAPTQAAPAPAPSGKPLKEKLVGTWVGKTSAGADLTLTFNADGTVAYSVGTQSGSGSWTPQGDANPTTLQITRKLGSADEESTSVTFSGDDAIALTNAAGVTTNLTRKPQ